MERKAELSIFKKKKIVMPLLLQKITQKCANTNIHNANILIYNF